jgi:uncharacterized membrane protein YgdD (TMEM256/DUF423 family)
VNWTATGAIALGLAVMLGAFGAHALRDRLNAYELSVYERAVFYHFIHGLGLLIVSLLPKPPSFVCWLLLAGIVIFCGSLYGIAMTGVRALGAITPFGGVAFIAAWFLLAYFAIRGNLR